MFALLKSVAGRKWEPSRELRFHNCFRDQSLGANRSGGGRWGDLEDMLLDYGALWSVEQGCLRAGNREPHINQPTWSFRRSETT